VSIPTKDEVRARALDLGIDLVGFCRLHDLEEVAPEYDKPSQLSSYLTTLIVLARRYPVGVAGSPDDALRQYATGRSARHLEEAAAQLAYWLEERDTISALLSAIIPDLRRQPLGYSAPAGQGSLLLRQAAVASGLGSLGLNQMLLTPQFGPRIFLAGIVSDLAVAPDSPFASELCPGLEECGRCAAVCPEQAIPLEARAGAPLHQVRALDHAACIRSSQPYGPQRMVEHLRSIFTAPSPAAASAVARSADTEKLWFNMTVMRQGAFTGCARCELVCPVGDDWPAVASTPARQRDLPREPRRWRDGDLVRIESFAARS
jgi:ferredoxin